MPFCRSFDNGEVDPEFIGGGGTKWSSRKLAVVWYAATIGADEWGGSLIIWVETDGVDKPLVVEFAL